MSHRGIVEQALQAIFNYKGMYLRLIHYLSLIKSPDIVELHVNLIVFFVVEMRLISVW